jgi:hypothetical protein
MANQAKIVFLGATSMSFGLSMLRDIFSSVVRGSHAHTGWPQSSDTDENHGAGQDPEQ